MSNVKKELEVAALENGTVIDHIPAEHLFQVVSILELQKLSNSVTIGNNLCSKKIGFKGIIKIADHFFKPDQINKIALLAQSAKINIIKNYEVVEKKDIILPEDIHSIIRCCNPKCITNNEPMQTLFHVIDSKKVRVKCHYCEQAFDKKDIQIK